MKWKKKRGDLVDGTPSRLGSPYHFGVTGQVHDWSRGKKNVSHGCVYSAVNGFCPGNGVDITSG